METQKIEWPMTKEEKEVDHVAVDMVIAIARAVERSAPTGYFDLVFKAAVQTQFFATPFRWS